MWLLRRAPALFVAGLLLLISGCGGDPLNRQAVSGKVTFKGRPLEHGKIEFSPLDGQTTLMGAAITNGEFNIPAEQGLSPGKYKVMINAPQGANLHPSGPPGSDLGPQPTELIPSRYNEKSDLRAEVTKGGLNAFDFPLD
jgi:hypothetical protein